MAIFVVGLFDLAGRPVGTVRIGARDQAAAAAIAGEYLSEEVPTAAIVAEADDRPHTYCGCLAGIEGCQD
jgi:hypothetical protein